MCEKVDVISIDNLEAYLNDKYKRTEDFKLNPHIKKHLNELRGMTTEKIGALMDLEELFCPEREKKWQKPGKPK